MAVRKIIPMSGRGRAETPADGVQRSIRFFFAFLAFQLACAFPFFFDIWGEVLGLRSTALPWYFAELTQVLASAGLLFGIFGAGIYAFVFRRNQRKILHLDQQIGALSGEFQTHLNSSFLGWSLSRSEAEVATFAMKGFSNPEIAEIRGTTTATVKSQMNAIYRKSGFANRQQLTSFLIEEMLANVEPEAQAA